MDIYLDENELELKKNMLPIMRGEWDYKLTDEEQRQARIKLRAETDLTMPIQGEMTYIDYLFVIIRCEQRFDKAFTEFLRDFKIDSIIGSDS
jgi:hypothetical protein